MNRSYVYVLCNQPLNKCKYRKLNIALLWSRVFLLHWELRDSRFQLINHIVLTTYIKKESLCSLPFPQPRKMLLSDFKPHVYAKPRHLCASTQNQLLILSNFIQLTYAHTHYACYYMRDFALTLIDSCQTSNQSVSKMDACKFKPFSPNKEHRIINCGAFCYICE